MSIQCRIIISRESLIITKFYNSYVLIILFILSMIAVFIYVLAADAVTLRSASNGVFTARMRIYRTGYLTIFGCYYNKILLC